MPNRQTQICVFNDPAPSVIKPLPAQTGSNLIDIVSGVDGVNNPGTGAAQAGYPVILNPQGRIDSSLLGQGTTAAAGEPLAAGNLVHLYNNGGTLTIEKAYAAATGTAPDGGPYPVDAQGFVTTSANPGDTLTVSFVGLFVYNDPNSEFGIGDLGKEVYLSDNTPGGVTKTRPSGLGELDQSVGYVVAFVAPNQVTVQFIAGFKDFTQISGVAQISQGGTSATTAANALVNLGAGSYAAHTFYASPTGGSGALTVRAFSLTDIPQSGATSGQAIAWNGTAWVPQTVTTPPAAPTNSIQFNNAGAFGGTANFIWNNASNYVNVTGKAALGDGSQSPGKIDAQATNAWELGNPGAGGLSIFDTAATITGVPTDVPMVAGRSTGITYAPSADASSIDFFGSFDSVLVPGTNSQQIFDVYGKGLFLEYDNPSTTTNSIFVEGFITQAQYNTTSGTGTIDSLVGIDSGTFVRGNGSVNTQVVGINATAFMQGSGTVPKVQGIYVSSGATAGTVTNDYSVFVDSPDIGGTVSHHYGLYIADQTTLSPDPWGIFVAGGKSAFVSPVGTGPTSTPGEINGVVYAGITNSGTEVSPTGASQFDVVEHSTTFPTNDITAGSSIGLLIDPAADASGEAYYGQLAETLVPSTNAQNINQIYGFQFQTDHNGSGNVNFLFGGAVNANVGFAGTTSPVSSMVGLQASAFYAGNSTCSGIFGLTAFAGNSNGTLGNITGAQISAAGQAGTISGNVVGATIGSNVETTVAVNAGLVVTAQSTVNSFTVTAQKGVSAQTQWQAGGTTISNDYSIIVETPLFTNGTATHHYGLYIADQVAGGGVLNPDPWAIFVAGGVSSFKGVATNINTQTTTYTATYNDHTINCNGTFTLTLPTTGLKMGQEFYIKNIGTGTITVSSAANIDGSTSLTLTTQYQSITVQWDGTQYWIY